MHKHLTWLLRSPPARAPYVVLFHLKPLIEDGNLQVYKYYVHARKRASGAPRTLSRACKISQNFLVACPRPLSHNPFFANNFLLHHYVLFQLAQLWECGYLFPKRWKWQICHIYQAFKLPLHTFSRKLRNFPPMKSKTIGFLLDLSQQYTPVPFAKTPRELLPEKELLSGIMRFILR